ncbi:molybdopterin-binding protein [Nocardioides baekrokdamisoli]|uniref:Molybdopterin-binding protein n=1 Tax=Nocardioides baekrokdamisoli TaxID=1804624 RepID=A0A3G9IDH6_9ACTN|nr:molybdopterin-dependent oxidoreductase [Nocardioides baekrokdamisoli]BBH17030.1 molybdopterin-binding protein [Nocardioides baekrokdamisoli]
MQSTNSRGVPAVPWAVRGVATGGLGLAVSWVAANLIEASANPVVAVATEVIDLIPGSWARFGEKTFGTNDKDILVTTVLAVLMLCFAAIGLVGRTRARRAYVGFIVLAAIAAAAIMAKPAPGLALVALSAGLATMVIVWTWLTDETADLEGRRGLLRLGVVGGVAVVLATLAPSFGRKRRAVEAARGRLTLPGVTPPVVPSGADLGLAQPWMTPASEFYKIDTTITSPAVDPGSWTLRIHGMVDRELTLTFEDLLARQRTQAWVTLCCVSNPVGGPLIGNAWWSGVRIAPLLAEAGVRAGADAVLQTSADGWTCGTPLSVLTDDRNAMLAVAMNGKPLPIDHGFPVRTVVPGLYGYVSATKWVVDLEVTTMDRAVGYWIPLGWSANGPVKLMSRIDRPSGGSIPAGDFTFAGIAWEQHTGIEAVEVALDGGVWTPATLARTPGVDTWVQWSATLPVAAGNHQLSVRATDRNGNVQTAVQRDVVPDGATGWDTVQFRAG